MRSGWTACRWTPSWRKDGRPRRFRRRGLPAARDRRKGLSPNTITAYRRDLGRFQRWLGEVGIKDLADVTAANLGQFVAWASREEHLSATSVRRG